MISVSDLKTGVRHPLPDGDEVVEFACPRCYYVWLEYSSAENYPQYCPGCGRDLDEKMKKWRCVTYKKGNPLCSSPSGYVWMPHVRIIETVDSSGHYHERAETMGAVQDVLYENDMMVQEIGYADTGAFLAEMKRIGNTFVEVETGE